MMSIKKSLRICKYLPVAGVTFRGLGEGAGFAGNGSSSSVSSASVIDGLEVVVTFTGVCRPFTPGAGWLGTLVPIVGLFAGVFVPLSRGSG